MGRCHLKDASPLGKSFHYLLAGSLIVCSLSATYAQVAVEVVPEKAPVAPPKAEVKTEDAKTEPAKEDAADKKKEAPANPFNNLIRNIFGGAKPQGRIIPQNPQNEKPAGSVKDPANGDEAARDRIDARAPNDPQMAKLLRQAAGYMEAAKSDESDQKWGLALDVIKYVLDPARPGAGDQPIEDALVRGADGKWTTMRQEANRLLAEFPPDQLAAYRQQFGGLAQKDFDDAKSQGNIDRIVTVATQFFHTPAGMSAANWMGMRHFDHGEFGMAARWFRQLMQHEAAVTQNSQWKLKAAVAFQQSGDQKTSTELLEQLGGTSLRWGNQTLSPSEFVARLHSKESQIPELEDWPVLYGSSSHLGKSIGGDPLLLARWIQPLTNSQKALDMIDELLADLIDEQYAPVPAFHPIMVNGNVIFRTLRGVRVVDVTSGETRWETRGGITPERLITGIQNSDPQYMDQMGFFGGGVSYDSSGSPVNNNRLASLLFRNGQWGGISSDGKQLFVLEDHAVLLPYDPGNYWAVQNGINDSYRRDYSTNKIVSYDLETGRPRWEIGGTAMDEPFDRRLAGQYFLGVPVADQDELFAIGEQDNEIRMFALDNDTGREKWSQLVAYSDAKIDRDFGRRWWNAQVGVGQGVVVCPTTMGWLVGIDRLNHSVMWAYRYSKPQTEQQHNHFNGQDNSLVPNSSLNTVWGPSAPIIIGNRVVFTPPEHDTMLCLDLFSGEKLWSKQKDDYLYLAGVFEELCLLIGKSNIAAISLESGSTLWTIPLTEDDGKPCGMGIAVGNLYHLPLTSGQLWTLNLTQGKVATKAELPDGLPEFGNLGMYRGLLFSLGPHGLTAFAQQQAIEAEILTRRKQNPDDAWSRIFEANIHALRQEYEPALDLLQQAQPEKLTDDLQQRYRRLMMETLTALIQSDFAHRDEEYAQLQKFVESEEERLAFRRMTADRLRARKDYQSAFDEYLSLAESNGTLQINRDDDRRVKLSLERWLAGRLEQLWREVSGDDRARLNDRIAATASAVVQQDVDQCQRFLVLFGFHPQAVQVRRALVEDFALSGEIALAQNQLLKLSRDADPQVAAMALDRMARLFRDQGLPRDADYYWQQLSERYPQVPLENGQTVAAFLDQQNTKGVFGSAANQPTDWSDAKIEYLRTGTNYSYYGNPEHDLQYTPYRLPYFQDRRFRFFQSHQRLGITLAATDEMEWLIPLKSSNGGSQGNLMPSDTSGHVLFVVHAGILHALSPIDKKILWTHTLDPKSARSVYYNSNQLAMQPMQRNDQFNAYNWLQQDSQQRQTLAVVNSDYICVLGRRELSVLDAVTGRLRWSKDRLPGQARVYGTDSLVFVVPPDTGKSQAFSSIDGRPIDVTNLGKVFQHTARVLPQGLLMLESKPNNSILGLTRGSTLVHYYDPSERKNRWAMDFPNGTYLSMMDDNYLAALKPTGELSLVDMETGKLQEMKGVSEEDLKSKSEVRAISDHRNLYLLVNKKRSSTRYYYYNDGNMPGIAANGTIYAWDRETGKFLWKQDVTNQQLMLTHFTHSPLLIFNMQTYKQLENIGFTAMSTLAIDKFTGKIQVDVSAPNNYSSFRTYDLSLSHRMLEFRSYQLRLRITALPPGSAEAAKPNHPAPAVAE